MKFTRKDLKGCYIVNDHGELLSKFTGACQAVGYPVYSGDFTKPYICCDGEHIMSNTDYHTHYTKQLTLADFAEPNEITLNKEDKTLIRAGAGMSINIDHLDEPKITQEVYGYGVIPTEACKPQYTQAMVDAKQRCEVGMQCMVQVSRGCEKEAGELLGWHHTDVWVLLYDGMCTTVIKSDTPVIFPMIPVVVKTPEELLKESLLDLCLSSIECMNLNCTFGDFVEDIMAEVKVYKS